MAVLEVVQAVLDVLASVGEVTFQGVSIYLLVRRVDEKEKPPK
ncbi:hypothetical protein [Paenisporosarcina quisquiliarum]